MGRPLPCPTAFVAAAARHAAHAQLSAANSALCIPAI